MKLTLPLSWGGSSSAAPKVLVTTDHLAPPFTAAKTCFSK
jgi:hypothetical protein